MNCKKISDSKCEGVYLVLSQHINGSGRLFGGILLQWIDTIGAVVARRHSGCEVTTASIDNLQFVKPVTINSTVVIKGYLTYVGHTSMEVCVETYTEDMGGQTNLVNKAYLVFVAMKDGRPTPVPGLLLESEREILENENGCKRQELRRHRRAANY